MDKGRIRKLAATAQRAAKAYAGDPKAVARLVRAAARKAPRALRVGVAAAIATAAGMAMMVAAESDREVDIPIGVLAGSGKAFNAAPPVWTSYQIAGSVLCLPGGGSALWTDSTFTPPVGDRLDWRLVAAIGQVESGHAFGTPVNAFGDLLAPLVGPALDVADTDGGRFDHSASRDARVGPLGLLPSEVVTAGLDGNGDQIVDPHNVWDSAATAASVLCGLGGVDDPAGALLRWRSDTDWAERVLDVWGDMERTVPSAPGTVPWGAPLAYTPTSAAAGPVLAALMARWGGSTEAVECVGGECVWRLAQAPEEMAAWTGLREAGFAAPVALGGFGVVAAGDPTRNDRIAAWHPNGLAWPLASTTPPQPDGYETPTWWAFALSPANPVWTGSTDDYQVELPVAAGAMVYSPTDGRAEYHAGGCVEVTDEAGSLWRLCGVRSQPTVGAPPATGPLQGFLRDWPRLEHAAGLTAPALLANLGTFACRTVSGSDTWSQHSWHNAVDLGVDIDGNLQREPYDLDSQTTHDALTRLTRYLARTMANPHTRILEDGSTLIQDQAPQLGAYQIRNLIFHEAYTPGDQVVVTRHDEHLHVDFWAGDQRSEPDCAPHEVTAGELLGIAYGGTLTVAVTTPEGLRLCPQALFEAWAAGKPLTPADLDEPPEETDTPEEEPEEGCDG